MLQCRFSVRGERTRNGYRDVSFFLGYPQGPLSQIGTGWFVMVQRCVGFAEAVADEVLANKECIHSTQGAANEHIALSAAENFESRQTRAKVLVSRRNSSAESARSSSLTSTS